ncbi:pleiotropic drug resistance protein 1-like [Pistacia vera]|uniref:pleiotropic drug resistance protein 1-like n=1 Tax=Pistacia vera TaxID=55513 RepID=UPI001263071C|nr:pleiotropic drug resistance protein 1-like [Pistacia vera]
MGFYSGPSEIDIHKLGFHEKQQLIDRLVKIAETDNEQFLLKLKNRIDRVGIELPKIEVRFEHVNVEGDTYVGSRALPTFINFFHNIIEGFLTSANILKTRKKHLQILQDVSGIIRPGRMTLLLGPPAAGKTTLLLALAVKLDSSLQSSGRVTYNGHEMHEFVSQRTAAYIGQHDVHIGEMTVRETLAFSARCQGVGTRYEMLSELSRREKGSNIKPDPDIDVFMKAAATAGEEASMITDYILKILGLEVCADTLVGDEMVRGISGGKKKRATTGEMLVGPANALFMDEISTGLDSSTTFQIVNCIRQSIHILDCTALISLLQPAPETYDLFDDIILLSEGQIVYQGPREQVLEFFESMGFKCPERKGVADFLQEVTSGKDQQQYWTSKDEPYRFITVKEFSDAFQSFHVGRKLGDELATPFDKRKSHPAALTTKTYGVSKKELLKACFSREFLLMKRNSFVYYFKLGQLVALKVFEFLIFLVNSSPEAAATAGEEASMITDYILKSLSALAGTRKSSLSPLSLTLSLSRWNMATRRRSHAQHRPHTLCLSHSQSLSLSRLSLAAASLEHAVTHSRTDLTVTQTLRPDLSSVSHSVTLSRSLSSVSFARHSTAASVSAQLCPDISPRVVKKRESGKY